MNIRISILFCCLSLLFYAERANAIEPNHDDIIIFRNSDQVTVTSNDLKELQYDAGACSYIQYAQEVLSTSAPPTDEDLLYLTGYTPEHTEEGIIGEGEINDKVRITFMNGILNCQEECILSATMLSMLHGNENVHYICRTTAGIPGDFFRAGLIKCCGWISPEAYKLVELWKTLIAEMGGVGNGGSIVHYVHSLGGSETELAGTLMTPEERAMIRVFALGSFSVIPEGVFSQVSHYVSWRDLIFFTAASEYLKGAWNNSGHVVFVNGLVGTPLLDHSFRFSYRPVLEQLGADFISTYGAVR